MADYRKELGARLASAQRRVRMGVIAKALNDSKDSVALFAIIDEEISVIANDILGTKPLDEKEYISKHGEMKGLKRLRQMIEYYGKDHDTAAAEVEVLRKQLKDLDGGTPTQ